MGRFSNEDLDRVARLLKPSGQSLGGYGAGNVSGPVAERLQQLRRVLDDRAPSPRAPVFVEAGDLGTNVDGQERLARLPVPADIWWLHCHQNLIWFDDDEKTQQVWDSLVSNQLEWLASGGRVPALLKTPRPGTNQLDLRVSHAKTLKLITYETRDGSQPFTRFKKATPNVVAHVDIPVGPLGVMGSVSFWVGGQPGDPQSVLPPSWEVLPGGTPVPPKSTNMNALPGKMLLINGYLPGPGVQYPGEKDEKAPLYQWLRIALDATMKWPAPGDFMFVLAKPLSVWPWWWQDTSPLFYAGHFFETENYTGGTVLSEEASDDPRFRFIYKVRCKWDDVYVVPTDWMRYQEGDRVALVKFNRPQGKTAPFQGHEVDFVNNIPVDFVRPAPLAVFEDAPQPILKDWRIVPVQFYPPPPEG